MKLLVVLVFALPLVAAKTPLTWTQAVVESSLRQAHYGEVYHEPAVCARRSLTPVRESIYIDAGEWQYHVSRSEEHTSELQSLRHLVCRLLLEKRKGLHHVQRGQSPDRDNTRLTSTHFVS